jgi:hypothetical protein
MSHRWSGFTGPKFGLLVLVTIATLIEIVVARPPSYVGDYIWVPCYNDDMVYKINVSTSQIEHQIRVGDGPCGIAVGPKYVYVTHRFSPYLYRISKNVDMVADSIDLGSVMAFGIGVAVAPDSFAYVVGRLHMTASTYDMARIAKISPNGIVVDTASLGYIDAEYTSGSGIHYPAEHVLNCLGIGLDGAGTAVIPWSRSYNIASGVFLVNIWDLSFTNHAVAPGTFGYRGAGMSFDAVGRGWNPGYRLSTSYFVTYSPSAGWSNVPVPSGAIAWTFDLTVDTSGNIWTARDSTGLIKYTPATSTLQTYTLGTQPTGMAIDRNGYLWVSLRDQNKVAKFDLNGNQIGSSIIVGDYPMGIGDMTGYECPTAIPPCCNGRTGNVNMTGIVDSADLASLINYLTGGGYALPCIVAANINALGIVDSADLAALVSYLTFAGFRLPNCP